MPGKTYVPNAMEGAHVVGRSSDIEEYIASRRVAVIKNATYVVVSLKALY